jgi:dihydropyrimidinase
MIYDLVLKNGEIYVDQCFLKKNIYINGEKIVRITDKNLASKKVIDCTGKLVMPGFIDPHVHFELDLGEFSSRDDFYQGSKIAALGGVTTFIDFLDPILTNAELTEAFNKRQALAKKSLVDYSFHVTLGNYEDDPLQLIEEAKALGLPSIKVFTTYSESNRRISLKKLYELISDEILVLIHSEKDELITKEDELFNYKNSRPWLSEYLQILEIAGMTSLKKGNVYIVHTTCGSAIQMVAEKFEHLLSQDKIIFESCPQYFYLNEEKYVKEDAKLFLIAPPLRNSKEMIYLKSSIDHIRSIGTDHCAFTKADKEKYHDVSKIPKGFGSIEYSFALMYNLFGEKIIDRFTKNPAKIFGLYPQKGKIELNTDADLVIFDPNKEFTIDKGHSNAGYSPYEGIALKGKVESTLLRGEVIVKDYKYIGESKGNFLRRKYESN